MEISRSCLRIGLAAVTVALVAGLGGGRVRAAEKLDLPQRWFYLPTNLLVDANVTKAEDLFARGQKAGYNGVLLSDSKFSRLGSLPAHYFANVEQLKKSAAEHQMNIIPAVFPLGWSNDILGNDPNLAEGVPVKDALFVVKGGEAHLEADPPVTLKAGDFANLKLWGWHDPGASYDPAEKALKMVADGGNLRISQKVKLAPWREYRVTVRIKTADFRGQLEVKVLPTVKAEQDSLSYTTWNIPATSAWKTYTLVFNSLANTDVQIYFGSWGAKSGTVFLQDARLEEVGLLNILRRPGTPLTAKREGGSVLVEGKDFAPVKDPKMGNIPWPGEYDTAHDAPPIKILAPLPDGTRLRVSWYHPMIIYGGSVMLCPSEPKTVELLRDQATRVHKLFAAKSYFMAHDEIRVMNWDAACLDRHLTPGQILADNVHNCIKILKEINPGGTIYVWSDMFDPHHNAHDHYYLVNGDLAGSWKGLDKDVVIGLWYLKERDASMKFFSGLGNRMIIAGYYDSPVENMSQWLDTAQEFPGQIIGTMYTTWQGNYRDLEAFEQVVDRYRK